MANLATLKAAIDQAIYQNNQHAITGDALNTILNSIVDTLGTGYRYAGVATPSANPGTVDNRIFYLATAAGTYTNFGGAVLDGKALHVLYYDTTWHNIALDVPTSAALPLVAGSNGGIINRDNTADGSAFGAGALSVGVGQVEAQDSGAQAFGHVSDNGQIIAGSEGAHAEGRAGGTGVIEASDAGAHAEGYAFAEGADQAAVTAGSAGAHAEGCSISGIIAATGMGAHAEGHADGDDISADANGAHAEGNSGISGGITASGEGAHAEGSGTTASGVCAHAEGLSTTASGAGSHAEGNSNTAQNAAEHAEGRNNASHKKTTGTAAEQAAGSTLSSIGCGASNNDRKNAVEVMQNGDVYIKGVGGYDGTNPAHNRSRTLLEALGYVVINETSATISEMPMAAGIVNIQNAKFLFNVGGPYEVFQRVIDFSTIKKVLDHFSNIIESFTGGRPAAALGAYFVGLDYIIYDNSGDFSTAAICLVYFDEASGDWYYLEDEM